MPSTPATATDPHPRPGGQPDPAYIAPRELYSFEELPSLPSPHGDTSHGHAGGGDKDGNDDDGDNDSSSSESGKSGSAPTPGAAACAVVFYPRDPARYSLYFCDVARLNMLYRDRRSSRDDEKSSGGGRRTRHFHDAAFFSGGNRLLGAGAARFSQVFGRRLDAYGAMVDGLLWRVGIAVVDGAAVPTWGPPCARSPDTDGRGDTEPLSRTLLPRPQTPFRQLFLQGMNANYTDYVIHAMLQLQLRYRAFKYVRFSFYRDGELVFRFVERNRSYRPPPAPGGKRPRPPSLSSAAAAARAVRREVLETPFDTKVRRVLEECALLLDPAAVAAHYDASFPAAATTAEAAGEAAAVAPGGGSLVGAVDGGEPAGSALEDGIVRFARLLERALEASRQAGDGEGEGSGEGEGVPLRSLLLQERVAHAYMEGEGGGVPFFYRHYPSLPDGGASDSGEPRVGAVRVVAEPLAHHK